MYVRTNKGQIFDCIESEQMGKPIYYPKNSKTNGYIDYNEVYKKSSNIIDICEVGDYVNGMLVIEETPKDKRKKQQIIVDSTAFEWGTERLFNEDIKSIVTKEQFESMEYKVKE